MSSKVKTLIGFGVGIPLVSILALLGLEFDPESTMRVDVHNQRPSQALPLNESLTLLSWNIQFAGSRKHHFFYDGGRAVHVPKEDVLSTLDSITQVFKEIDADILLIQEVDRHTDRTANIDELEHLRGYTLGINWASTPYHKVPYVPHPSFEPMGRVNLHLSILSKYRLLDATRTQLSLLQEPRWRQYFNLKRAILETRMPIGTGQQHLIVANTHLSAFSHGDGTLSKQIATIKAWMDKQPAGQPWILAGDFNLLPPNDTPNRLGDDALLYADSSNPIVEIYNNYAEVFEDALGSENRTYLPVGSDTPDRKIDYIFYGGPIEIQKASVLSEHHAISDHLPIRLQFRLTTSPSK